MDEIVDAVSEETDIVVLLNPNNPVGNIIIPSRHAAKENNLENVRSTTTLLLSNAYGKNVFL